jgi:hypothetical protein
MHGNAFINTTWRDYKIKKKFKLKKLFFCEKAKMSLF